MRAQSRRSFSSLEEIQALVHKFINSSLCVLPLPCAYLGNHGRRHSLRAEQDAQIPTRYGDRGDVIISAPLTGHTLSISIVLSLDQFISSPKHTVKIEGILVPNPAQSLSQVNTRVFLIRTGSFQTLPSS